MLTETEESEPEVSGPVGALELTLVAALPLQKDTVFQVTLEGPSARSGEVVLPAATSGTLPLGCLLYTSLFGLLWTGVAVAICVMHGINLFSKKGIATHEVIVDDADASVAQRLEEVRALYEQGLITQAEYEAKRKELLDQL